MKTYRLQAELGRGESTLMYINEIDLTGSEISSASVWVECGTPPN